MSDAVTKRDPVQVEVLARAHELFKPRMQAIVDAGRDLGPHLTDEETMTAAYAIIFGEWIKMRIHDPSKPVRCGWCILAGGDTDEAALAVEWHENSAAVRKHTEQCEHNPLVVQRGELRSDLERKGDRVAALEARLRALGDVEWLEANANG